MLIFDLEADGLLAEATRVHCVAIIDADTGAESLYCDDIHVTPRAGSVADAVERLAQAPAIAGHNIIKYDIPLLEKLAGLNPRPDQRVFDSLVSARVIWTNLYEADIRAIRKGRLPHDFQRAGLCGSHSLAAWGHRLGEHKGDFTGPWDTLTQEMADYCVQDVRATRALCKHIWDRAYSDECLDLEHAVARIIARQERRGFSFDVPAGEALYATLLRRRAELEDELRVTFEPWEVVDRVVVPKRDNAKLGYKAGVPVTKYKTVMFNPASRDHIADRLMTLRGWKPEAFTDGGKPKVDETILSALPYPEAKLIAEYLMVVKRCGQLGDGNEAWLKNVVNGRIHGGVNTNGAVTGRMTHSRPNLAQVPRCGSPYGAECRSLFTAGDGLTLVGCDAEGLELRMLAHYMARWDNGAYVETVVNGRKEDETDVHSVNRKAVGLRLRDSAKTFIYALIYGAGDYKLGTVVYDDFEDEKKARFDAAYPGKAARERAVVGLGKARRASIMSNLPALGQLVEAVKEAAKKNGHLRGLDGRKLHVRSEHAALNTLLQSGGAVVMKQALVIFERDFIVPNRSEGATVEPVANIHDEIQMEVSPHVAEQAGRAFADAISGAGSHYGLRCPLSGSYSSGRNWAETH